MTEIKLSLNVRNANLRAAVNSEVLISQIGNESP